MTTVEKMSRDRVNGFLRAVGTEIRNGADEPVILTGWGLGNWLLCEGYMWRAGGNADRPRRIEQAVRELAGSEYAENFWKKFRGNYVTERDIARMAELGYNSVRVPINWRVLMADEPGIIWLEDGFKLIDDLLDRCENYRLYVFLDLHGAPGGQTGANIDDCVDDFPRLFTDEDSWRKGIALWGEIARRYADRWIVGGYDLLNEPIRPDDGRKPCAHLVPRLARFYDEAIAAVRVHDKRHMFSIEGHNWATNPAIFNHDYDPNMLIHFHRYATNPDEGAINEWLALSERWQKPLWLGESGENTPEWFAALYPLCARNGIGYNIWPWKKMDCTNSPYSVKMPKNWNKFIEYTSGGDRPSYAEAQAMFDEYLENMLIENCVENPNVSASVRREPGCSLRATDFDSGHGRSKVDAFSGYRRGSGLRIVEPAVYPEKRFGFDCRWDATKLALDAGEYADYTFYKSSANSTISIEFAEDSSGEVEVFRDGASLGRVKASGTTAPLGLSAADEFVIRIKAVSGQTVIERIIYN